jgi:transcription antitermination factor NusG
MPLSWYALNSHPNKEDLLYKQIETRGFEAYFPRIRVNPVNPRSRKIRAYFPGYLFVRVDLDEVGISTFNWMPYAKRIISFGGEPSIVPDALIVSIKKKIESINESGGEVFNDLKSGDEVSIASGPFEGYEAIFDTRLDGAERVRILLKMLSDHYVPVDLDVAQIEKKKKKS